MRRLLLAAGLFTALVAAIPAAALHASAAEATIQARGYWLVVASDRDGQTRPYSIRSDGSRLTPLAPRVGGTYMQPMAVSRDGSTIAYSDTSNGPHKGIYVSRANGTGLRRVVRKEWYAGLSPNGKTVAVTYGSGGPGHLYVIGTDGRGRRRLGSGTDERVEWSPNGKALLVTVEAPRFPRKAIVIRPLRGGRDRMVVRGAWIGEAKWSPDGRWIAYSRLHGEDRANGIYAVRPNGTGRHRVAPGWAFPFSWSRDGRRLAFSVGSKADVGIVGVDGRGLRRLRLRGVGSTIDAVTWTPDGHGLIIHTGQIWIVGANGRGLRRVTKMVGGFELVGWTRVAPAGPPAAPLLPSERVVAPNTVATGTPIAGLSADGSRVAFVVKWTAADCDHVVVWTPATSALDRFVRPVACPNPPGGHSGSSVYDVELAGSRAAWVSAGGCGNFCDITMESAILGQRSPSVIAKTTAEYDTDFDFHLHGHGELLVFNDRSRLVRIGAGTQKCQEGSGAPTYCTLLRRGQHAESADSVSGPRIAVREPAAVAVVDEQGGLVRVFPFASNEVRAARLDGNRLVVATRSVLEVYDVATGMGVAQQPLPAGYALLDVDGGIAVLRHEESVMLLSLADGRSRTLTPGAGPVLADLEPPGLYYSYSTPEGSGRVVFLPRSQIFTAGR